MPRDHFVHDALYRLVVVRSMHKAVEFYDNTLFSICCYTTVLNKTTLLKGLCIDLQTDIRQKNAQTGSCYLY